jgi:hypothetical protein
LIFTNPLSEKLLQQLPVERIKETSVPARYGKNLFVFAMQERHHA